VGEKMDDGTEYMLTTVDNPYNPFTDFDAWIAFDIRMGYNTSAFLARVAMLPEDLPEPYQSLAIQNAIDEIVQENVSGMWRKVSRESFQKINPP
jgi:hypothetical protein